VLGQVKVADKSNEIVAIPALLELMAIEGAIVTIDAMGCQRAIAQKIIDKKADYVLALKGNQGTLREDVEEFAAEQKAAGFKDTKVSTDQTIEGDHGRIETRTVTVFHDAQWLKERHDWPGLQSFVMVESVREIKGDPTATERETRFYITSLVSLAYQIGPVIRGHWAIENSLHWIMDVDSDEAGHAFQLDAGHPFRSEAGHRSDLKPATWRRSRGSSLRMMFSILMGVKPRAAERWPMGMPQRYGGGRPGSQQEGPARDAACPTADAAARAGGVPGMGTGLEVRVLCGAGW
jgi:predicted transposase YbfD/YdcC